MKDLRIVFLGTPDFAVASLKAVLEEGYNVVGVITAPDKPAGRGRKLNQSAVKQFAQKKGLPILQPTYLKDEKFLAELKALNANLQIIVAFRMLPKVVWDMPEHGTFNLHASLLPNYRGAAPINWAIMNGETQTGVTTFFIDEEIDTGAIIMQEHSIIGPSESAGELHDKLMYQGSQLVIKTVKAIQNDLVSATIQPETEDIKTAYKIHKHTCKIDWSESIDAIHNKIRGLSPYPAAWSNLYNNEESTLKIYEAEKVIEPHQLETGTIVSNKNSVKVAVKEGFLDLKLVQLPGKRKMEVKSLLNGYSFNTNAKML
ncbi:methionyl-tRNA formyltransferase [Pseudofulvibacter geojedonensis]|uniref:Methionyl-tRNA formyltransferase n=1 Tax=Pseudofulvibacter geojedonensis TaxID=1123758 RepID=A0ABW3HZA9_9FLAO